MTVSAGVAAALLAPLLEAAGFLEWDIHWKRGGGSAFALNLYKCNLAAFGFLCASTLWNNRGYMRHAAEWGRDGHTPYGHRPRGHIDRVGSLGGTNDAPARLDTPRSPAGTLDLDLRSDAALSSRQQPQPQPQLVHPPGAAATDDLAPPLKNQPRTAGALAEPSQARPQLGQKFPAQVAQLPMHLQPQEQGVVNQQPDQQQSQPGAQAVPSQGQVQFVLSTQQQVQHQQQLHQQIRPVQQQGQPQIPHGQPQQLPLQQQGQPSQQDQGLVAQRQQPVAQTQVKQPNQGAQQSASHRRLQQIDGGAGAQMPMQQQPQLQPQQIVGGGAEQQSPSQQQPLPQQLSFGVEQQGLRQRLQQQQVDGGTNQQGLPQQLQQQQGYGGTDRPPPPPPRARPLPDAYSPEHLSRFTRANVGPLVLSSLLGILIGDCAELEALRLIGARRVLVVDTIKPFAAALLGRLVLKEPLCPASFLGMVLTAYGVYIVLMDSLKRLERAREKRRQGGGGGGGGSPRLVRQSSGSSTGSLLSVGSAEWCPPPPMLKMEGMRWGSISRHDFFSDCDDALVGAEEGGDYDDLGLFPEDGRNNFCRPGLGSCRLRRWTSSFGSTGSFGSWTNGSLDSGDGFGFDDDDDDDEYFFRKMPLNRAGDDRARAETAEAAASRNEVMEMPLRQIPRQTSSPPQSPHPAHPQPTKSALRRSRFSVSALPASSAADAAIKSSEEDGDYWETHYKLQKEAAPTPVTLSVSSFSTFQVNQTSPTAQQETGLSTSESASDFERNLISSIGVSIQDPKDGARPPQPIVSVSSSSGLSLVSASSFGSECGPPPDWYPSAAKETRRAREVRLKIGYALATLNVLLDAHAALITKEHGAGMTTWEINLIRMGFAGLAMLVISAVMRLRDWVARGYRRLFRRKQLYGQEWAPQEEERDLTGRLAWYRMPAMSIRPWIIVSVGVLFVTFLSPALANYALFEISLALSITLGSVTPLFTLPLGWLLKGERPTLQSILGGGAAVLGVIVLCIWGIDS